MKIIPIKCQICGDNLPMLEIYDAAMLYSPLWGTNNGITLCEPCHKAEHKKAVI